MITAKSNQNTAASTTCTVIAVQVKKPCKKNPILHLTILSNSLIASADIKITADATDDEENLKVEYFYVYTYKCSVISV